MKLYLKFWNYKKIEDFSTKMESGYLYSIRGGNEVGKTSFLQGLATILNVQNKNKNPITFGKDKATLEAEIYDFKDVKGNDFHVKVTMEEGKEVFLMINAEGKAIKSITEIRDTFKYNPFTVDDWFGWGLTAEGRRKQGDICKKLFPEDVLKELLQIEAKINSKTGTLYLERRGLNTDKKTSDVKLQTNVLLSPEVENIETYEKVTKEIETMRKTITTLTNPELISELQELKIKANGLRTRKENEESNLKAYLENKDNSIKELEEQIEKHKADKLKAESDSKERIAVMGKEFITYTARRDEINAIIPPNAIMETDRLQQEIIAKEATLSEINYPILSAKKAVYEQEQKNNKIITDKLGIIETDMDKFAKRKSELYTNTNLPLDNIAIVDDECMYVDGENLLPFTEESVSYSQGGVPIAKLIMHLNPDCPIVMIGKASEYGIEATKELANIAKEYNGIIIVDEVLPGKEDLQVKIYED